MTIPLRKNRGDAQHGLLGHKRIFEDLVGWLLRKKKPSPPANAPVVNAARWQTPILDVDDFGGAFDLRDEVEHFRASLTPKEREVLDRGRVDDAVTKAWLEASQPTLPTTVSDLRDVEFLRKVAKWPDGQQAPNWVRMEGAEAFAHDFPGVLVTWEIGDATEPLGGALDGVPYTRWEHNCLVAVHDPRTNNFVITYPNGARLSSKDLTFVLRCLFDEDEVPAVPATTEGGA